MRGSRGGWQRLAAAGGTGEARRTVSHALVPKCCSWPAPVPGMTTNISVVRELGPLPAYERVPGLKGWPTFGSSSMLALRHLR